MAGGNPSDHPVYAYHLNSNKGRDDKMIPIWRGIVQSETGLEDTLQKLPPESAERARLLNSQGRTALESCEWRTAAQNFVKCTTMLEEARVSDQVDERVYNFLLVWAYLPLAQLYQLLGSFGADRLATLSGIVPVGTCTDMLRRALFCRGKILDCVDSLGDSPAHALLKFVCRTYFCTALYELGDLTSDSEKKEEAVGRLASMVQGISDIVEAEAFLCFYLWCDHYYIFGNLEVSWQWIRKANRLWRENNRNWNSLQIEVQLSMKLEKFEEAEEVLKDSMPSFSGDHKHQIHQWLQQCYTQMSPRMAEIGGDSHQTDDVNALAVHDANLPSRPDDTRENISEAHVNQSDEFSVGTIPKSHPLFTPSPVPIGSWLGLVQTDLNIPSHKSHLQNLPEPIYDIVIKYHLLLAEIAYRRCDWETATCNFQMCREFLKLIMKILDPKTYDWLLTWFDLPLAYVYQYRVKKSEKAIEIWKEMKDCAMHLLPSDEYLTRGYVLNLDVAEFEWKRASKSEEHVEKILRRRAERSSPVSDEKAAERELCFWLYCHHYCQGNYEASWKWLREAKKLKDEHSLDQGCSSDPQDYFCCEYTFLRCEADLCMRLQMFEKAIGTLRDVLETRHVEGNPRLKREANQWLRQCLQKCGCKDEPELEDIADESPSPTGCYFNLDPTVEQLQLVQSQTGLEHHLHKLPVPIHLAFRRHGELGRINQRVCDWESVAFNFEWCKEVLKMARHKIERSTYDWLVVWADVPLVEIYGFVGKMQHRKVLELLREIFLIVSEEVSEDSDLTLCADLLCLMHLFTYQCAVSDYPELKDEVIKSQCKLWGMDDHWDCEEKILLLLFRRSIKCGNYEASCQHIHELNERLPESEWTRRREGVQDDKKTDYLLKEVVCLASIGRIDEAKRLTLEYWEKSGNTEDELPVRMQILVMQLELGRPVDEGSSKFNTLVTSQLASSEITELRSKSDVFLAENKFQEAVKCLENCLQIFDRAHWVSGERYTIPTKSYDYKRLGIMHMERFLAEVLPSLEIENIKDVQQDKYFSGAVKYFNKCIELPLPNVFFLDAAEANYVLVLLYGTVDDQYGNYLRKLYDLFGPHREQQRQQSECGPCSSSGLSASDAHNDFLLEGICHLIEKIEEYLAFQGPMDAYGKLASSGFTSSLYTMVNQRNAEGWIQRLETFSGIYPYLQSHYYRKATFAGILRLCYNYRRAKFASISDLEHNSQQEGCPYLKNSIEITSNTAHIQIEIPHSFSLASITDFLSKTPHMKIILPSSLSQEAVDCGKEAVDIGKEALHRRGEAMHNGKEAVDRGREVFDEVFASKHSSKGKILLSRLKDEGPPDIPDIEDNSTENVDIEDLTWKAFTYAERERARVMVYEVGSDRLNYSASRQLWSFDADDAMAVDSIRRDCSTLLQDDAVFVQYSRLTDQKTYLIYVVDQQGKLSVTHTTMDYERAGPPHTIEDSLTKLYKFLEPQRNRRRPVEPLDKPLMLKELEYLYDVLIEPIAHRLAKMKIEHKLILAPTKLLWQVPFAALRNRRTGEYLVQRHTIASTASLRTLKVCSDRLKALQSSPCKFGLGSVVALGHPAYRVCDSCDPGLPLLEESAKEVEHIANLFGGTAVVKQLLWEKATAEELLHWAARPSREGFRQALVHIGSHAEVSDGKNVLHLACPNAKPDQNDSPTVIDEKQSSELGRGEFDYEAEEDDENHHEGEEDDETHDEAENDDVVSAIKRLTRTRYIPNQFSEQFLDLESIRDTLVSGEGPSSTINRTADSSTRTYAGSHVLKAEDIWSSQTEWRAELVVLSACSTSRGKRTAVEGVLSMARAFMTSGVPCTVASLWKVDDKATSTLMKMFYDELRKEGTDVASALCSAMRKGLDPKGTCKFPVKFWAPFIVYGLPTLCLPPLPRQTLEHLHP